MHLEVICWKRTYSIYKHYIPRGSSSSDQDVLKQTFVNRALTFQIKTNGRLISLNLTADVEVTLPSQFTREPNRTILWSYRHAFDCRLKVNDYFDPGDRYANKFIAPCKNDLDIVAAVCTVNPLEGINRVFSLAQKTSNVFFF